MRLFRMLGRCITSSFQSIFRNFSLSLASISSIAITLIVVAVAIILSYNVNNFSEMIKADVTLIVFIDQDITEEESIELENILKNHSNVESYEFFTKEDVKNEYIESSAVFETIMTAWNEEENPLYDEYEIKVKEITNLKETADEFVSLDYIVAARYGEGIIDTLIATFNVVGNVSYGIVAALLLVTAFLITNTIKLTIYSRKQEIDIMRLVGASNFFIRLPYLFEGIILGTLGALVPIGLTVYGYTKLYEFYGGVMFSPIIKLIEPTPFIYYISAILLGIAVLIGMLGSFGAVRRYLKI